MDSNTIHTILEKYWEGESTLQEEAKLREFFSQEDIPKEFESVRPLFQFFKQEQEANLNGDFDERFSSRLKAVANTQPRAHSLSFYIRRIAAVAAILAGVLFFFNKGFFNAQGDRMALNDLSNQEKAEAQIAYAEVKTALLLLSKKLKKGTDKADAGISQVRKATKVIKN
ncbi:MAG: hypothetical protein ACI8P3_000199 [Saprospiraceae bacterium]|jgi:hypothetical protein